MRFIFKTSYAQDLRLAKHGGHLFWYGLLGLALLAALLGAAEVGVQLFAAVRPTPWLAMASALCSLAASVARIVAQPRMRHDGHQDQ